MTTKLDLQPAWPEIVLSAGLLAMAGIVAWQTGTIAVSPLYAKVGPTVFPYFTAGGLVVFALLLLRQGFHGGWQDEEEKATPPEWTAIAYVVAGLVANVSLIKPLGFTAASVILFTLVARGFGSRRLLRDAAIGLLLALAAYFGFAGILGVNIGGGIVENLLGG